MIRIKTAEDIAILKEGGRRHAEILNLLRPLVVRGASTFTLNDFAMKELKKGGDVASFLNYKPAGAKRPYPAALCVSINDEIVHGIPNENPRILEEGDIVTLDLGLTHKGLITDAAITLGVGKISKEDRHLIESTEEALRRGIDAARGGNTVGDIGQVIEQYAKEQGFVVAEGLSGHGVGYEVHEDPYVPNSGKSGEGEKLIPGMVIAIEPMLMTGSGAIVLDKDGYTFKTKNGSRSAHAEHTVLITEDQAVVLTK